MAEDDRTSDHSDAGLPATTAQVETQDRGTFLPLIFGGAVAAALGFFGSQIDAVERALGLAPPDNGLEQVVEAQAATIAEQQDRLAALEDEVRNLPEPAPPADLSGLESQLSDQAGRIDDLAGRMEEVEKRPMTDSVSEDAIAAYEEELQRLQSAVSEQRSEIEALLGEARDAESDAERQSRMALARATTSEIIAALDNGEPFASELEQLRGTGVDDIPEPLAATAEDGVATLGALQTRFPEVARAGLRAAREAESATGEGGLGAFLERQLGARSVVPQEGSDPDAVLSRAEAAVLEGRLGDALTEIEALPDASRSAMGDWISQAETRHEAVRAAQALMTALATN